jgi:hypothetical protein
LGTPLKFKNNVKASIIGAKENIDLDQYILELEAALKALRRSDMQAGGLSHAQGLLRGYSYRQSKVELDQVSDSMFGSTSTSGQNSVDLDELVTVSIWTQVNAAEFYPHFQIYRNLFDMTVYFSQMMDGQKPEMTAGIAETLVDRLLMGWEGELDHLSQHYRLIFNLVDWGTFCCIRREAIAFLDQQTSREVFRIL